MTIDPMNAPEFAGMGTPTAPGYNSFFSPLQTKQVPREHPRLLGSRARLQGLAKAKPDAYRRTRAIALAPLSGPVDAKDQAVDFGAQVGIHAKMWSLALCAAIEEDRALARQAIDLAIEHFLAKPVRVGHDVFGGDVGEVAMVYDLCHEHWTEAEKKRFHAYLFECRDRNVDEELGPFHDGWWGYKQWGFVLGLLAVMYETDKEPFMLQNLDREFRLVAAECLRLAGDGGGYSEGFYVNYYIYVWVLACEAMRECTGADYLAHVPEFYKHRAVTMMFEHYPGARERGSRRSICVGDGRGRFFKVERDSTLAAMRILVDRFRDDPDHQAVAAYLGDQRMGADENAYRDLLFGDPAVKRGDLARFRLSHVSPGPGFAYARSDWTDDAAYLFFKCGKRVTAHQHLDVGHFFLYRREELAGEGGHYCDFSSLHDTNHYIRTISHNCVLVKDPDEQFRAIRGQHGRLANDGGQRFPWPGTSFRHNGDAGDADMWRRHPELGDTGDITAFHDAGAWMYVAGDCTKAYDARKLALWTRQIVFLRPGTVVIFDRVTSTKAEFAKTWLLHAMGEPTGTFPRLNCPNGAGRLHIQTVLPAQAKVRLVGGDEQYRVDGGHYPPRFSTGQAPACRIEVSPAAPATADLFLHVLTMTDAGAAEPVAATATVVDGVVRLAIGADEVVFHAGRDGGSVRVGGKNGELQAGVSKTPR